LRNASEGSNKLSTGAKGNPPTRLKCKQQC
jgi:hypothetical protein